MHNMYNTQKTVYIIQNTTYTTIHKTQRTKCAILNLEKQNKSLTSRKALDRIYLTYFVYLNTLKKAQEICFSKRRRVIDELDLEITMMPKSMVVVVTMMPTMMMMMTLMTMMMTMMTSMMMMMMMMMTTVMMEKSMIQSAASPKGVLPTSI